MVQLEFNFNERKGQMAVEWLIEQLRQLDKQLDGRRKSDDSTVIKLNPTKIYEQAKAIEKEQIMESWKHGNLPTFLGRVLTAEEYYNETFTQGNE